MKTAKDNYIPPSANPRVFRLEHIPPNPSVFWLLSFYLQDLFTWWYVEIPIKKLQRLQRLAIVLDDKLSISLLLKTVYVPWHNDRSFVGYFIGIIIRILYLPFALAIFLAAIAVYFISIILWFVLPFLPITMIILNIL